MIRVISDTKFPIKIWASDLEEEAEQQVRNLASLPFIYKHIAVQADAHAGKGSTVGTVLATNGAIIPACIGVDLSCGMIATKLPFKVDVFQDLPNLRHSIERAVPVGRNTNKTFSNELGELFKSFGDVSLTAQSKIRNGVMEKSILSIGTLGGGNHFIEICSDQENNAWIMLHSGSRNIGKCLAEIHIEKAKSIMKEYFISLPDPDLAYLAQNTPEFNEYIHDINWAEKFAKANREEMMNRVLEQVYRHLFMDWNTTLQDHLRYGMFKVNCSHNYTKLEHHFGKNVYITRKGAVSAKLGEWGIIPGSMSTGSFIVQGLGNSESFCSCSHGSGRKMSRTKAREMFTKKDLEESLKGIEARTDESLIDEIQYAYKDLNVVMDNQADLVIPVYRLLPILNVKG